MPAQLGQLKTGQDGKGLLQIHLWSPNDLPRLWDRIDRIDYCPSWISGRRNKVCGQTGYPTQDPWLTSQVLYRLRYAARQQRREDLLRYKPKSEPSGTLIPFVMTYHPEQPKVKEIVNKHWLIIESSKRLNEIFPQKIIMVYRRPKSLS